MTNGQIEIIKAVLQQHTLKLINISFACEVTIRDFCSDHQETFFFPVIVYTEASLYCALIG